VISDLDEEVLLLHRRGTPVSLESGLRLMLHPSHTSSYREKGKQPGKERQERKLCRDRRMELYRQVEGGR
jgi:hypothetical protein